MAQTVTPDVGLPPVGYSIAEVERILGIPPKTGYRLVKTGKLKSYVDSTGTTMRVSPFELYAFIREQKNL